jgi:hypothetical protein
MNLPVTPFNGFLRCIRLEALDERARDTIDFVCKHFFGRDIANQYGISANESAKRKLGLREHFKDGGNETPFAYRRFAGDAELSRGRYYTVANGEQGNDGGTLECELGAYSNLSTAGPVWIHDTLNMEPGHWFYFWRFWKSEFSEFADFCTRMLGSIIFHFDYKKTNVSFGFADEHTEIYTGARLGHEFAVAVPTITTRQRISTCIDLRLPKTRDAMMGLLDSGLPNLFTCDENGESKPLNIIGGAAKEQNNSRPAGEGYNEALIYSASELWNRQADNIPLGLPRLLGYFTYAQRGGSPITDAIGRYLRFEGIDALIFPSARCDVRVDFRKNELQNWGGWNLVDYRDAPKPHARAAVVIEPESWRNPLFGYEFHMPPDADEYAGSFTLKGPRKALHDYLAEKAALNQGV